MKNLSRVYIALCFIILYAPIAVLMLFSFNSTSSTGVFSGFSLYWYRELFKNANVFNALRNTLILAVTSSVTATVIGTGAAVGLDRMRSRRMRGVITSLTNVPMMNPDIVTGVSMMLLFVFVGTLVGATQDKLNFWTLFIAHVTFNLPYVILNITPKLKQMDRNLPEAAQDLGCTPLQSFFKVELPAIMPGVLSGLIMAFTLSLDDFVISYFTSGSDFQTLPILIYSMTKKEVKPDIYALSTLIIITILALLLLSNFAGSRSDGRRKSRKTKKEVH
ncbi:MAG: ABC transporter permease [Eubacteriales bacterium]|nr:ABC transporter permease [Clostridiales bacterium]MDD7594750.1 ABC transporter permease [Clostridiales bacterium]MDY5860827.1 ABC transporter permease [Eubacteriales bacterium]